MRDYSKSVATKIHPLKRKVLNKQKLWKALEYSPSPNQLSVHNSTARFRVNVQGRRSGKSYSAAKEILPYILTPNTRTWIVGPTLDLADKIMREVKVDIITKLRLPIAYKKEISGAVHYMKLAGLNSEVSVKSADRPESLVGDGIDHLVVEEAHRYRPLSSRRSSKDKENRMGAVSQTNTSRQARLGALYNNTRRIQLGI